MKILGYFWTIFINIVTIVIIFSVLNYSQGEIVVPILVIIYLSIVQFSAGFGYLKAKELFGMQGEFNELKSLLFSLHEKEESLYFEDKKSALKEQIDKFKTMEIKFWINSGFVWLSWVIAIFYLISCFS
jgi:hypothetical protein